jgi:RNA polymerase sigma-70 factor (ECF subfamily)
MRHRKTAAGKAEQRTDHEADFESIRFNDNEPERLSEAIGLYQALAAIPLEYREALLLHYREGLVSREIADMIGISVSGAKMRIKRGLEMLRQQLKEKNHASSQP